MVYCIAIFAMACGRVAFEPHDDDAALAPADGYFVETRSIADGAFGGLAGADAWCWSELSSLRWRNKDVAQASGQLQIERVHAWLCVVGECRELLPLRRYIYASVINADAGGASFIATGQGYLFDDDRAYEDPVVFGDAPLLREYFTGRDQDQTPQSTTCSDWTRSVGDTLVAVSDTEFYGERLSKYRKPCSNGQSLICMIDPLP
ncbi:MAG: hypothetical protein ACKV2T_05760 [Kofleriaceae bacterium]